MPVAEEIVKATLPFARPQVRAMANLQQVTGMRPNEVCRMRACDIDMTGPSGSTRGIGTPFPRPDDRAGSKGACPTCGQRVQVPQPTPSNKTRLGKLLLDDAPAPTPTSEIPKWIPAPAVPVATPASSITCPRCRLELAYKPAQAGGWVTCPRCAEMFTIPGAREELVEPLSESELREERRRRQQRYRPEREVPAATVLGKVLLWLLVFAGGAAGPVVLITMLSGVARGPAPSQHNARQHNARCPLCGERFDIPEKHRGTAAEFTRSYSCPNCGESWPATVLYKNHSNK
jgi:hypothetical protein